MQGWPNLRGIDAAILVLLLTVGGYSIAFTYQAGYLAYFGLPSYFAEVGAQDLLLFAGALTGFFFVTYNLFIAVAAMWPTSVPRLATQAIAVSVFVCAQTVGTLWLYGAPRLAWIIMSSFVGFFVFMELGAPILIHRQTPGYFAKVEASISAMREHVKRKPEKLLQRIPLQVTSIVAVLYTVLTMTNAFGTYKARTCEVFLVDQVGKPCVVLRSMSDGLLCATFDAGRRAVDGSYRVLKPEDAVLRLEKTGRLSGPKAYDLSVSGARITANPKRAPSQIAPLPQQATPNQR